MQCVSAQDTLSYHTIIACHANNKNSSRTQANKRNEGKRINMAKKDNKVLLKVFALLQRTITVNMECF